MIKAGQLRQRINVERKYIVGTGDRGQPLFAWQAWQSSLPAMVEELSGRKLELARQLVATATHRVTIRYLSGLDVHDRISLNGRVFNLGAILDRDLLHFSQELLCTEELAKPSFTTNSPAYTYAGTGSLTGSGRATGGHS